MPDHASRLPARPSLEQLQKQAKELLRQYRGGEETARNRFTSVPQAAPCHLPMRSSCWRANMDSLAGRV